MVLSVSVVVLLGVLVWFLIRHAALRGWQALICILFGFYLSSTSFAPYIRQAAKAVARFVAGIDA